jgi:hypothetical protein
VESDVLERAEAAWNAGKDELTAAGNLPPPRQRGAGGGLQVNDLMVMGGTVNTAAGELARIMGELRDLIDAARGAGVARELIERTIEVQTEKVSEQSREVRSLRLEYELRWRR